MLNTGINKQEFNEYKKKTAASILEMQEKFESLTEKFDNSLKTIVTQNDRIEKLQTNLTSTLDTLRTKRYFHYNAVYSVVQRSSAGTIKFNSKISSSSDNSYNPETGLFTAPCDGVFVFIVQFHVTASASEVGLYIDNKFKSQSVCHGQCNNHLTTSLITHLNKGQVVEARLMRGQIFVAGSHTSFQGFQI